MSPNPYLNRSMIRSVDEFIGRHREIRRILSRIGAGTPQSVSIVGERRMGKSSLLWHLAQPQVHAETVQQADTCLFILLDFQGQQHLDQDACCALLARRTRDAAGSRLPPADNVDSGLDELLATAQAADVAGLRLVFLLDEFETVTRNAAIDASFYGALRSLANAHAVAFVTASRRPLQSLCHSQEISESPFFNIFTEVVLGPMPDDEVAELIAGPSAAAGIPLAAYAELIRDLGGNLPFFVQMAASAVIECIAEGTDVNETHVRNAFLQEASGHFRYFLEAFAPEEQDTLLRLARGESVTGEWAEHLLAQGFLRKRGDRLAPFSSALLQFCEDEDRTGAQVMAQNPASEPLDGRRLVRLGAVVALALAILLTAGLWFMEQGEEPAGLQLATLSPARVSALGLSMEVQIRRLRQADQSQAHQVVMIDEDHPHVQAPEPLFAGDRLRLALSSHTSGMVYVFLLAPDGQLQRVPQDASRPTQLQAGTILLLPSGQDWLPVQQVQTATHVWELLVIASDSRQGDLEDQLLRQRQASSAQRDALTRSVVAEIRSRAAVALRFHVAPSG